MRMPRKSSDQYWTQPLLITGCPRTGSTALTRSLSTHPGFCLFNEYHLYGLNSDTRGAWRRLMTMPDTNQPPECVDRSVTALRQRVRQAAMQEPDAGLVVLVPLRRPALGRGRQHTDSRFLSRGPVDGHAHRKVLAIHIPNIPPLVPWNPLIGFS